MSGRPLFRPQPAPPMDWKPEGCADCGVLHPSFSLDGSRGPWRCGECDLDERTRRAA